MSNKIDLARITANWVNRLKADIIARDLSMRDELYDDIHWQIDEIVYLLTMHQLIQEQKIDGDLEENYDNRYRQNFNFIKEGVIKGELVTVKSRESEGLPTKPKFLSGMSLRFNLRWYSLYVRDRLKMLNPDNKLFTQFLVASDFIRYAKDMGVDFPERPSISKAKDSISDKPQVDARLSEQVQGFGSTANGSAQSILDKEAVIKEFQAERGTRKGKDKDKVVEQVTKRAIEELGPNCECRCNHSELAIYLMGLKADDGLPLFTLPGIIASRYIVYFLQATSAAFLKKGLPLRNKKKDEPRGRKYCKRHPLEQPRK